MARSATNPLAAALDKRIRAMVEETVAEAVKVEVREVLREELAELFGTMAVTAAAPAAPAKRKVGRPKKATTTTKATRTTTRATKAKATEVAASAEQKCGVADCKRPYRSRGYCAAHYQAARKYGWPMPAPKNFVPPPRPSRGRPPKAASA